VKRNNIFVNRAQIPQDKPSYPNREQSEYLTMWELLPHSHYFYIAKVKMSGSDFEPGFSCNICLPSYIMVSAIILGSEEVWVKPKKCGDSCPMP
jgi:hypothetical protein